MDELINKVAAKIGVSPDKAKQAVETVVSYLKSKLPGPVAAQIDGVLSGGASGIAGKIGGLLGKK